MGIEQEFEHSEVLSIFSIFKEQYSAYSRNSKSTLVDATEELS